MSESMLALLLIVILGVGASAVVLALYFTPTIIALSKHHKHVLWIFLLNLITGASLIGWAIAFAWSCMDDSKGFDLSLGQKSSIAREIKELSDLKNQGIISEEDFEKRKNRLLES